MLAIILAGGGFGYWTVGGGFSQPSGIGDAVKDAGYPWPEQNYGWLSGGEGYGVVGRLLVGGGGAGLSLFGATSSDYNTSVRLGWGYFSLGYALLSSEKILLFPSVGIGGGGITVEISGVKAGNFKDLLKEPPMRAEISSGGAFFKGSLTFLYRYSFLVLGITAGGGYLLNSGWSVNDNETTGYPRGGTPLFWAAVNIGGGWW